MFTVFKNTLVYQLSRAVPNLTEAELQTLMPHVAFTPCSPQEASRIGWLMDEARPAMFVHGNNLLMVAVKETKDIPATIIKEHLNAKRDEFALIQGRKLRRSEVAQLKDDVIQALLPRAFPKRSTIQIWVDVDNGLVSVDTASPRTAEQVLGLLRRTLGSLPVVPVATEIPFEQAMTDWLKDASTLPAHLSLSDKIKKADLIYEDGEVRFSKEDRLNNEEAVSLLLEQGRQVCTLGIHVHTPYGLDLELTHACKFKRLQFSEAFTAQHQAEGDALSREYADFILMVDELRTAYRHIFSAMGGLQAVRELP